LRRTFIPVLLTLGVASCALGSTQWLIDSEYPLSAHEMMWTAVTLPILGVVLLALAIVNMLYVRRRLLEYNDKR